MKAVLLQKVTWSNSVPFTKFVWEDNFLLKNSELLWLVCVLALLNIVALLVADLRDHDPGREWRLL